MPLTEKENFMKCINGETPDWVPRYGMGPDPFSKKPLQCATITSAASPGTTINKGRGRVDQYGVEYIATEDTGWQQLPVPDKFILDDVRNWRNIVHLPDMHHIDWDALAKYDLAKMRFNPNDVAVMSSCLSGGFFMPLMNLMGFTNGLIAMHEEPEAVHEMFDYMATSYCYNVERMIDRYPIDIFTVGDDTAAQKNPFISPQMYREMIKPYVARVSKYAQDRGIPVMMHNCGRCEDSIDDWRDFGVNSWNPAQVYNDLAGIKKKYGNSMVLIGCWDSQGEAAFKKAPEEVVRQAVRDCIDNYAAGGGYMFWGSVYGPADDVDWNNKKRWMTEEYEAYREHPYK